MLYEARAHAHDMAGISEMAWWPRKKNRGRHSVLPGNGHLANQAVDRATEDLKRTIMRRQEVDKLVLEVRRAWRTHP
jgi:hypothetical protein